MHRHHSDASYVPALSFDWLTPAYDFIVRWTIPEDKFRGRLIEQMRLTPGQHVLDIGCGTGSLCLAIARRHPGVEIVGIDGDPRILELARTKARTAGLGITFTEAMSFKLPYPDQSFDRVCSTLMLHHLTHDERIDTCREALRVLRPAGELHVGDWGRPHTLTMRLASLPVRLFDGHHRLTDNIQGRLPEVFRQAGFEETLETDRFATAFGTLALYRARKPSSVG